MEIISAIQVAAHTSGFGMEACVGVAMAVTMLGVEMPRRFGLPSVGDVRPTVLAKSCVRATAACLPEIGGVTLVASAAVFLRFWNAVAPSRYPDPVDQQVWETILREWPILNGADTLLGFQAMLRLFILLTLVLRTCGKWGKRTESERKEDAPSMPFSGMAAMFTLAAMIARVTLTTSTGNYEVDGPLGAQLPVTCEMAMVPLLTALVLKTATKMPAAAAAAATGAASWWASQHYLNFAENPSIDSLYTLAHVLEIFASLAFLSSTVCKFFGSKRKGSFTASAIFVYIMMAVQQSLAAYYYLNAWDAETWRAITGAGRPACILLAGNLMALGAYLVAAAMFLASYLVNAGCEDSDSTAPAACPVLAPSSARLCADSAVMGPPALCPAEDVVQSSRAVEDQNVSNAIFL